MNRIATRRGGRLAPPLFVLLLLAGCSSLGIQQGGFNMISVDQEWGMRDDLRKQVAKEYRLVNDRQANQYLAGVGRKIVAQTPFADRRWDFGIVDDDKSVNAFNLPGGLVYVTTGLIREAETLDQLAAVMGHEVAHGAARHGTQLMTRAAGFDILSQVVTGGEGSGQLLANLVGTGVLLDYSRDAEREADALGVRYAHGAGYDPRGAPAFFRKLLQLRRGKPSDVQRFFSSHPLSEERIKNTERLAAELPRHGNLVRDTRAYQNFRRKFR